MLLLFLCDRLKRRSQLAILAIHIRRRRVRDQLAHLAVAAAHDQRFRRPGHVFSPPSKLIRQQSWRLASSQRSSRLAHGPAARAHGPATLLVFHFVLRDEATRRRDVPRRSHGQLGDHRRLHGPVVGSTLLPGRAVQRKSVPRGRDDPTLHRPRTHALLRERSSVRRVFVREPSVCAVAQLQSTLQLALGHCGQDTAQVFAQDLRRGRLCASGQRDRVSGLRGRLRSHAHLHDSN